MESIADIIRQIIARHDLSEDYEFHQVIREWPDIVGKKFAEKTKAVRMKNNVLFVRAANPVWRTEIHFMKDIILQKYAEKDSKIEDIRFI